MKKILCVLLVTLFSNSCQESPSVPEHEGNANDADKHNHWNEIVITHPGVTLRKEPTIRSDSLGMIPLESTVKVFYETAEKERILGLRGGWKRILFEDKEGWVFGPLIGNSEFIYIPTGKIAIPVQSLEKSQIVELFKNGGEVYIKCDENLRSPYGGCEGSFLVTSQSNSISKLSFGQNTSPHSSIGARDTGELEIDQDKIIIRTEFSSINNNYDDKVPCEEIMIDYPNSSITLEDFIKAEEGWTPMVHSYDIDEKEAKESCLGSEN